MAWKVMSSIICPDTGIVYSSITSMKLLKLIIWYESDVYLYPGDIITPTQSGVIINGRFQRLTLYNVSPYRKNFWLELEDKMSCPYNKHPSAGTCHYSHQCRAKKCPHGFVTNPHALNVVRMRH